MHDISAFLKERNNELEKLAERVLVKLKKEVEKGSKEGKSKVIASCRCLDEELRECSKREGVELATSVAK